MKIHNFKLVGAILFASILWGQQSKAQPVLGPSDIRIDRLTTPEQITGQACRVETGSHYEGCGANTRIPVDVIYVPKPIGEIVLVYVKAAYERGYYLHLNKKDFFHGHLISQGPSQAYSSVAAYFKDLTAILFHSREYLPGDQGWVSVPKDADYLSPRLPRSFFGYLNSANHDLYPVIVSAQLCWAIANH